MLRSLWFIMSLAGSTTFASLLIPQLFPPDLISLDRCPVPRSVTVQNVTAMNAEISWFASDSALLVN